MLHVLRSKVDAAKKRFIIGSNKVRFILKYTGICSNLIAMIVLIIAPLPFGSVDTYWIGIWCLLMALSLSTANFGVLSSACLRDLVVVAIVLLCILIVVYLQMKMDSIAALLHPSWQKAQSVLKTPIKPHIAADLGGVIAELGSIFLFCTTFMRFRIFATHRQHALQVVTVLAYSAAFFAVISAVTLIIDPNMLLWRDKTAYIGYFTGTFINRNTAATYFGSISLLWLALILPDIKRYFIVGAPLKHSFWLLTQSLSARLVIKLIGLLICLAAVGATGSRAGLLLTILCLVLATTLYINPLFMNTRRSVMFALGGVTLSICLAYIFLGGSAGSRLASRDLSTDDRFEVYTTALVMIKDRFWLGHGLGSFEAVFPSYRPETISQFGIWDRVHSTPLEFALTVGMPLFMLVSCLWLWLSVRLLRSSMSHNGNCVVICAMCVGVLGTFHSFVDFSLQIPGYGVVFAAITATGVAQIGVVRSKKSSQKALI